MVKAKYVILYQRHNPNRLVEATTFDGLVFTVKQKDLEHTLALYLKDRNGWFFNSTKDRYIAEHLTDDYRVVNPQMLYQNDYEIVIED